MAGQEEADCIELLLQPFHGRPGLGRSQIELGRRCRPAAEQIADAARSIGGQALGKRHDLVDVAMRQRAVLFESVEGARRGKRFEGAFVERLGIEPPREIR